MEWGSSYIYGYQNSSEEELSCTELDEGMWLSESEGSSEDDDNSPPVLTLSSKPPKTSRPGFLSRMFASKDKKQKEQTSQPETTRDSRDSSSEEYDSSDSNVEDTLPKPVPSDINYVELQLPPAKPKPLQDIVNEGEIEGSPGKYAQLAELQKELEKEQQMKNNAVVAEGGPFQTPPGAVAVPPPPPPPAPMKHIHGIMKGGVKKQKKRRVRWEKSYRSKPKADSSRAGVRTRRTDTNILSVKFNSLAKASNLHTGDAEICSNDGCGAIVSHLTKLDGNEDDIKKIWTCEFCGTANNVSLVTEEVPTLEDTTYLLTPAAALQTDKEVGGPVGSDSLVIFCIDTSGSMCVTTEVTGSYDIRGAKERREKLLQSLPTGMDVDYRQESQYIHGQRRDVTWISRMQSVQAAVDTQLSQLAHTEPTKRVSLVTFSDDVVIFGDGRSLPVTMAGDKLNDSKAVVDTGKAIPLPSPVRDTHKALSNKIYSLEESGQTALGPAVLVSIVIASQKPGSKVIVCTDGLANVGLGGLDVPVKGYASAVNFYDDLAEIALEKGVTMSLLKIKGSDCRAVELGQVASRTGGHVTLVDPLTVTEEFGSILTNPVLATDVLSKVVLHQGLYFRSGTDDSRESVLVKQVGNVTADTEITYEYGIKSKTLQPSSPKTKPKATPKTSSEDEDKVKSKGATGGGAGADPMTTPTLMINGQANYPFQLQIEYTSLDGDKCLRVITQTKPLTTDRELAEREMDAGVVGSHVARQTAELTMQGEFTKARVMSLSAQKMLHEQSRSSDDRRWEYTNYCVNMIPLSNEIQRMQRSEVRNLSADEYEEESIERGSELMEMSFAVKKMPTIGSIFSRKTHSDPVRPLPKRKAKAVHRRQDMSDELSVGLFGLKSSSANSYRSPRSTFEEIESRPPPSPPYPTEKPEKPEDTKKTTKDNSGK